MLLGSPASTEATSFVDGDIFPVSAVYRGKALLGVFTMPTVASRYARERGAVATDGFAVKVQGVTYLLASPDPVALDQDMAARRKELRASGLSKLTDDERKALGLDKAHADG